MGCQPDFAFGARGLLERFSAETAAIRMAWRLPAKVLPSQGASWQKLPAIEAFEAAKVVREFAKSREMKSVKEKPTAPSVPRRSPIQVLTGLNAA